MKSGNTNFSHMKSSHIKTFRDYLYQKQNTWLWILLFTAFSQGSMLLTQTVGVDTADAIRTRTANDIAAELSVGRQGIVLVKYLTGHVLVNPLFAGVFTILLLTCAAILWNYLFTSVSGIDRGPAVYAFSLLLCSSPVLMEVFYFKVQALEIAAGLCLVAVSLLCTFRFATDDRRRSLWLSGAVLCMLIYMSIYQALVPLFVVGAQICFLLYFGLRPLAAQISRETSDAAPASAQTSGIRDMLRFTSRFILAFILGFGCNELLSALFFSHGNAYIDQLFFWGSRPVTECLYHIGAYAFKTLLGFGIYFPPTYLILFFFALLLFLITPGIASDNMSRLLVLDLLLLGLSPIYLPIAIGGRIPVRAQLTLPFTLAFFAWLFYALINRYQTGRKALSLGAALALVLTCYLQLYTDLDLGYTDQMRYQTDALIAHDLINAIDLLQEEHAYPVVFVGSYEQDLNPSCVIGEVTGHSMFAWDAAVPPEGVWSNKRCLAFLSCFGGNYPDADNASIEAAYASSGDIPCYPADGCVQLRGNLIIVKLSEP